MTDKRFTAIRKKNIVTKEMCNYIQDDGTTILELSSLEDCKDVCEILNEFNCEFIKLQRDNKELSARIDQEKKQIKKFIEMFIEEFSIRY